MTPQEYYEAIFNAFRDPDVRDELYQMLQADPDAPADPELILDEAMQDSAVVDDIQSVFDELLQNPSRTVPMTRRLQAVGEGRHPWLNRALSIPSVIVAIVTQVVTTNVAASSATPLTPPEPATPVTPPEPPALVESPEPATSETVSEPVTDATATPEIPPPPAPETPPVPFDWDNATKEERDGLNNRQKARDERNKILAELKQERDKTQPKIDDVKTEQSRWKIPLSDDQKLKLDEKIKAAHEEVKHAQTAVDDKKKEIQQKEEKIAAAQAESSKHEKAYTDRQNELKQLINTLRAGVAPIEKLRDEVKKAMDDQDWGRAYYKNSLLSKRIEDDLSVRDPNNKEKVLTDAIDGYEDRVEGGVLKTGKITEAKKTLEDLKKELDVLKTQLKPLEEELKRKQDGLETAISQFL